MESFDYIADTVKMPCILYNVPSRTGCNIQIETYCELAKNPYVVAVKEASGNAALAARIVAQCGDSLTVYSGEDNMTLSLMALGGKGVISVFSNALPRQMHDLAAAMLKGDLDTARAEAREQRELLSQVMPQAETSSETPYRPTALCPFWRDTPATGNWWATVWRSRPTASAV